MVKKDNVSKFFIVAVTMLFVIAAVGLFAGTKSGKTKANTAEWKTVLEDSFESSDFPDPWTRGGTNYTWGMNDAQASDGTYSIWCADKALGGNPRRNPVPGSGYADNMDASIGYGPIDLRNCTDAFMSFDIWRKLSDEDKVEIIATNNVIKATVIYQGGQGGWLSEKISFGNWNGINFLGQKNVFVKIRFYSNGAGHNIGAFIDNVVIKKYFTGYPDIAVKTLTVDPTVVANGEQVMLTGEVTNLSENRSQSNIINFYVSEDQTIDPSNDPRIGSLPVPELDKDEVFAFSEAFFIPVTLPTATYYVGGMLDPDSIMNEDDKSNNTFVCASQVVVSAPKGWETILYDDFEQPYPETYGWKRYADSGNYTWSREEFNSSVFEGQYSLWCAGNSFNGAKSLHPSDGYSNDMDTYSTYGQFDLTDALAADISLYGWYEMLGNDKFEILINAGAGFEGYKYNGSSNGWNYAQLDLSDWPVYGNLLGYNYVTFAIRFRSDGSGNAEGVYVDNVVIRKQTSTAVDDNLKSVPQTFALRQNYPNPFNPETVIGYALPRDSEVKITVFNIFGQKVRTLVNQKVKAGSHKVTWNGTDNYGLKVSSGVYFYKISAGDFSAMKKMILVQ
ncbi:T9SS type A sorting domain-containing protein [bacterium]|nr:T9SS type A sorting domain-containing protein [bacterium]